jgi:hypothetical protein
MRWRVAVGIAGIIAYSLLSTTVWLQRTSRWADDPAFRCRQAVASYDGPRFARLKTLLPAHGVVGYCEDAPEELPFSKYALTQYAVAPVRIVPSPKLPFVIGNFAHPAGSPPLADNRPLVHVEDLGDGVQWFRAPAAGARER